MLVNCCLVESCGTISLRQRALFKTEFSLRQRALKENSVLKNPKRSFSQRKYLLPYYTSVTHQLLCISGMSWPAFTVFMYSRSLKDQN